jgi:hypothetical protein
MANKGHRLSFLIVENEPAQGLSTRKLLIESAKHNVITIPQLKGERCSKDSRTWTLS